ncbi:Protein of unknown function [Aeromonas sp. RU39B]|uniref:DUF2878 domain-containing protein n=1 Tax=Aeromonas sp. RU39B TaxID=1907416 RepID=UPI000953B8E8|nr:DUF2878 domain-containing protein [Aeromonas sp. RU39B]SIQ86610.1 Protein of unknown function [Aeromonas sp. RU39B]
MSKRWRWGQLLGFNLLWTLAVTGAPLPWLAGLLLLHLVFSPSRRRDVALIPLAIGGFVLDLLLWRVGVFGFASWPWWLLFLWIGFIWSLPHGLSWLLAWRPLWQAAMGACFGPFAYLMGARLGDIHLPLGTVPTLCVLALIWSLLLPVLIHAVPRRGRL